MLGSRRDTTLHFTHSHRAYTAIVLCRKRTQAGPRSFVRRCRNASKIGKVKSETAVLCPRHPAEENDCVSLPQVHVARRADALTQHGSRALLSHQEHTDDEEIDLDDIYGEGCEHREKGELLLRRLKTEDYHVQALMRRLAVEYPGDIGIMMPLLLNYMRMGEGESFFMAANEPHAYLKGDILEVRNCSTRPALPSHGLVSQDSIVPPQAVTVMYLAHTSLFSFCPSSRVHLLPSQRCVLDCR